jgi:hypothetical protein
MGHVEGCTHGSLDLLRNILRKTTGSQGVVCRFWGRVAERAVRVVWDMLLGEDVSSEALPLEG